MPLWILLSQEVPLAVKLLLTCLLLAGVWLTACLCIQDVRTCHLDLTLLNLWMMLGISFAWALTAVSSPGEGLPVFSDIPQLLTTLLHRSLPAVLLLLFISLFLGRGIGGGDIRYLAGLAFWLPAGEFGFVLMGACLLSAAIQGLAKHSASALLCYRARALLPALGFTMIGRAVFLLLEWTAMSF